MQVQNATCKQLPIGPTQAIEYAGRVACLVPFVCSCRALLRLHWKASGSPSSSAVSITGQRSGEQAAGGGALTCLGHDVSAPSSSCRRSSSRPEVVPVPPLSPRRLCAREITLLPSSRADASCSAHARRGRPSWKSLRCIGATTRSESLTVSYPFSNDEPYFEAKALRAPVCE